MNLIEQIQQIQRQINTDLAEVHNAEQLERFRLSHLVKKGTLQALTDELRNVPKEDKPAVGKLLNELKGATQSKYDELRALYDTEIQADAVDVTLPPRMATQGALHPISQTLARVTEIFVEMGFDVAEGPEVEDDDHNFGLLNFTADHPARDMQDTFFVNVPGRQDVLLRTHTSNVQIRVMQNTKPPIRCIMPGKVFRNEAVSSRSLAEFHQVEGLYIDKNVSMADLKGTVMAFARKFYNQDAQFRFRTSYFPFTEPSAEVDMSCFLCKGDGCRVCKHTGWLELGGCGMVHPNVLTSCGIDPEVYSGFAFGFGIERVVMMLTGIDDARLLYENDVRILRQFST